MATDKDPKLEELLSTLEQEIAEKFSAEPSGHDIYHLKRVLNLALHLQEQEGGDKTVIAISALLHDIHRIIQHETGAPCSPENSLLEVKNILAVVDLPEETIRRVLHCVEHHEEYGFSENGKTATDIETLILQDADNLDAMGAVGVARCFMYSGAYNFPMYDPDTPIENYQYSEDKVSASTIHHFYIKLLKLKDNMHTNTAKQMAEGRHKFMEQFLKEFFEEWSGNR